MVGLYYPLPKSSFAKRGNLEYPDIKVKYCGGVKSIKAEKEWRPLFLLSLLTYDTTLNEILSLAR